MRLDLSTMATSNPSYNSSFTVGNHVRIITVLNKTIRGEIVSFDMPTKTLMLKSPSVGQHGRHDLQFFNMEYVKHVDFDGEQKAQNIPDPLPPVPIAKANSRLKESIAERKKLRSYVGENVSPEGQMLMDTISKTISDVKWKDTTIIVMDAVKITPPYTVSQCRVLPGAEQPPATLSFVRKLVEKFYQDERNHQANSQNDTRRSMSPSPAPSSSSTSSIS